MNRDDYLVQLCLGTTYSTQKVDNACVMQRETDLPRCDVINSKCGTQRRVRRTYVRRTQRWAANEMNYQDSLSPLLDRSLERKAL